MLVIRTVIRWFPFPTGIFKIVPVAIHSHLSFFLIIEKLTRNNEGVKAEQEESGLQQETGG